VATPPTRVSYNVPATGNFAATASPKTTGAFNVTAGDLIVVMASAEQAGTINTVTPSASGGSVTWTLRATQPAAANANQSCAMIWTGVVGATATGITVSLTAIASTGIAWWGFSATVWTAHGGVGTVFSGNNSTGSGAPSQAGAASCAANSAVQVQVNDWNAVDGTTRTWRTINGSAEAEATYFTDPAHHTVYGGYRADTGAAGAITQGLTAPATQRWVAVGVEILGTGGGGGAARVPYVRRNRVPIIRGAHF
jgi:hypothetical protein